MAFILRSTQTVALGKAQRSVRAAPAVMPRRITAKPKFVVRAEAESTDAGVDGEKLMKDLQAKWDAIDNKPTVVIYGVGAVAALWLSSTLVGAVNSIPVVPKLLELIGLVYSAWFTYRYLLFKSSREELIKDVEELKKKIAGDA